MKGVPSLNNTEQDEDHHCYLPNRKITATSQNDGFEKSSTIALAVRIERSVRKSMFTFINIRLCEDNSLCQIRIDFENLQSLRDIVIGKMFTSLGVIFKDKLALKTAIFLSSKMLILKHSL